MVGSKMLLSVLRMWTDIIGSVGDQRRKPEKTLPNASMSLQTKSLCARVRVLHTHALITHAVVLSSCSVYFSIYPLASIKHLCVSDEDVLDTWFSSGIFPFSIFGWPTEVRY